MTLSLFHTPGSIAFVDDDQDYLRMLALLVPASWHVRLFAQPQDCLDHLRAEPLQWEEDAWLQQQIIERWRQGGSPLVPQVLRYWAEHAPARYGLTHACVADYSMPQMDGLQMLAELSDWPGLRVLLTGQADEQVAVHAFNRGLIDQFLPKQAKDVAERLLQVLRHLPSSANTRCSQIWRSTLSPVQNAQLRVPATARALQALLARQGFVEHVVMGEPFGILGRTAEGTVGWLQLEPVGGLEELEALAESAGMDQKSLDDIREGRRLTDLELGQALGRVGAAQMRPAFLVVEDEPLLGALFTVDAALLPASGPSYRAWLAAQPPRIVRA